LSKDGATNLVLLSGKTPLAGSSQFTVPHKSVILALTTSDHVTILTNLPASKSKKSYPPSTPLAIFAGFSLRRITRVKEEIPFLIIFYFTLF
jgi:hypothetical protein